MTSVRQVARMLAEAGISSPDHDARVLIRHAADEPGRLDELVAARMSRVPLQHLVGSTGFRYLDLAVGPGVFVPRPESELLVDAAHAFLDDLHEPVAVDLCAGSGAIGLSIAHEHPNATVHLVERSDTAFEWLQRNARDRERVTLHHGDLADHPTGLDGSVDLVISNPPYVAVGERGLVDPEVLDHDPAEALWAGEDGLEVLRQVVARALVLLRPAGLLVVEHSDRHGELAPAALRAAGYLEVKDHLDLTGRPRFSTGVAPC